MYGDSLVFFLPRESFDHDNFSILHFKVILNQNSKQEYGSDGLKEVKWKGREILRFPSVTKIVNMGGKMVAV